MVSMMLLLGMPMGPANTRRMKKLFAGDRGFVETVEVTYDPERVSLSKLLTYYFKVIDPTILNQQGNDIGSSVSYGDLL